MSRCVRNCAARQYEKNDRRSMDGPSSAGLLLASSLSLPSSAGPPFVMNNLSTRRAFPNYRGVMTHLLIVDDETHVLKALRRMLLNAAAPPVLPDLQLTTFTSPIEALEHMGNHRVDLVISD